MIIPVIFIWESPPPGDTEAALPSHEKWTESGPQILYLDLYTNIYLVNDLKFCEWL